MSEAVLDCEALARRIIPPGAPRSHWDIAKTLHIPDGPRKGDLWPFEDEPVQVLWIRALDNPRWNKFTDVAPSQRGKSLKAIALPLVRTLIELAQNAAYIMPNLDKLNQNWEGKVRPLIVGCGYGEYLPPKGPGSRGGRPAAITLVHPSAKERLGTWYFMAAGGGGKETSLASVTAKLTASDEGDDFESDGHLKLGEKRAAAFGDDGQAIVASTVNDRKGREGHPVLAHWALGSRTRVAFQCPVCAGKGATAGFQVLAWEQVRGLEATSIPEVRASVRYECEHCHALWTEADRKRALLNYRELHDGQGIDDGGRVTGEPPKGRHYSLLSTDLDYSMSSLESMAEDWWVANKAIQERGDHSLMRVFYYKRLCRDYDGDKDQNDALADLTWQYLLSRAQQCKWGPSLHLTDRTEAQDGYLYSHHYADPPADANFAVAGVDVQDNRVYWVAAACALDFTAYDFAWGYSYARPDKKPWNPGELAILLDRTDQDLRKYCGTLPLALVGLDTGAFTDHLQGWLRGQRNGPWRAIKGEERTRKAEPGDIDGVCYKSEGAWLIPVASTRALLQASLLRPNGTPGSTHLPHGLGNNPSDRAYCQHLVGEKVAVDPKTRKEKVIRNGRWDWLDARRIAYAMMRTHIATLNRPRPIRKYGAIGDLMAK